MPFTTITKCTDCGAEFTDHTWHGHDCRTPEQIQEAEAEQTEWERKFDYWNQIEEKKLGLKYATMSVYDVKADDRAVEGKCVLVHRDYSEDGKPYVSRILNNPTWETVLRHFDKAIPVTGDFHHCFLEGIGRIDGTKYVQRDLPNDCKVYVFHTGS